MATREKNVWILILFILCGIVIGGLLGELASKVDFLWWLSYGQSFGLKDPISLDLSVIQLTFGLMFKINISSIIGMIPNCAASVILTELYIAKSISFGSIIAGLSSGAGIGLVVLFKENKNLKENIKILGIVYLIGVLVGILFDVIGLVI